MISTTAIIATHKELGLPTDEATIQAKFEEMLDAMGEIRASLTPRFEEEFMDRWMIEHPEWPRRTLLPGEMHLEVGPRIREIALEMVIEEYLNAPVRQKREAELAQGIDRDYDEDFSEPFEEN